MRANTRSFRVEELERRDAPAMLVPILSPARVAVATPDHWHAAIVRQFVDVEGRVWATTPGTAAGKINMQDLSL